MGIKTKITDLLIVVTLVLLSSALSIFLELNFLLTTLLFFGLPSVYLIFKKPNNFKKTAVSSAILGLIWGFGFDYVAELNNAWNWGGHTLIFPNMFFGVVSLDVMVWYFLWFFSVIAFYEYFVEYDNSTRISKRAIAMSLVGIILVTLAVVLSKTTDVLVTGHIYLKLGLAALVPFALIAFRKPRLFLKTLTVVPYFLFLYLVFELTALHQDLWGFSGEYVGFVSFGSLSFPLEELFFWIIVSSAVAVSYYEFTADDMS